MFMSVLCVHGCAVCAHGHGMYIYTAVLYVYACMWCTQVCCAVCVHGHDMCVHYCAVCVHGCGVCTGRETQGSSMNPPSGGEGRWRKVALAWMAMFLPSTVGRGHPGCCDIRTRGMSISPGQVRVGLFGGWCQAGSWSLFLHDESLCLSEVLWCLLVTPMHSHGSFKSLHWPHLPTKSCLLLPHPPSSWLVPGLWPSCN